MTEYLLNLMLLLNEFILSFFRYYQHLLRMKRSRMNARMEDTRDMVATFNPNTPPPLDGPSPRSPRRASAAAYAPAAPAAAAAAASPTPFSFTAGEYDPHPDEIARFREFTGSSELDARIELRLSKRLGKTFMEAVSYYAENHVEMATPTADAAAAAPVAR